MPETHQNSTQQPRPTSHPLRVLNDTKDVSAQGKSFVVVVLGERQPASVTGLAEDVHVDDSGGCCGILSQIENARTLCVLVACLPAWSASWKHMAGWLAGIWRGRVDGWRLSDTLHKFSIHFCSQNFHTVPTEIG